MNNLVQIHDKEKIIEFIGSLWRTDSFKCSHTSGYIADWVARFSEQPLLFFSMDDDHNEKGHFSAWMGAIAIRHYENPAINDLYYLHELVHLITMRYLPGSDFETWRQKMFQNELETSLESEVHVYFALDSLRAQSFKQEIWADRFLNDPAFRSLTEECQTTVLSAERRRIFVKPEEKDTVEVEISHYYNQNIAWAEIWRDSFDIVEARMDEFRAESKVNRELALGKHCQWMEELMRVEGKPYPFALEAESFARVYWANKK
jgi:hypothetical protein